MVLNIKFHHLWRRSASDIGGTSTFPFPLLPTPSRLFVPNFLPLPLSQALMQASSAGLVGARLPIMWVNFTQNFHICEANHSLFDSIRKGNSNLHSIFGWDKVIGVLTSPNFGGRRAPSPVPNVPCLSRPSEKQRARTATRQLTQ